MLFNLQIKDALCVHAGGSSKLHFKLINFSLESFLLRFFYFENLKLTDISDEDQLT